MKKLFSFFAAALMAVGLMAETSTWTMNNADGIAEIKVVKQGTQNTGGDMELTKDGITATSSLAYFAGSGTNGIQIYKTGTLTITAPAGNNITSIVFQYPKDCYPFAEALNEGGSATTKTPAQVDVTWTAETPANSFTFTNVAVGQTKVKKMVITYEEGTTPGPTNETIYYVNTDEWAAVNCYAWKDADKNGEWPGVAATKEENVNGWEVYSFTATAGTYVNCIFNNGNGIQTENLNWTAGKYYFKGAWVAKEDITEKPAVIIPAVKVSGTFNGWTPTEFVAAEDGLTASLTATVAAGAHEFKLVVGTDWMGNNGTMTRENSTDWVFSTTGPNCKLTADVAGDYTFTYTYATKALSVVYPSAPVVLTIAMEKTAEAITITPSDLTAKYYVGVLNPTYTAYWGSYPANQRLAFHADLIAEIGSQAALEAKLVSGVQTITLADYTTEGYYQVVAGAMHYDADATEAINNFVIDSEVAAEDFTIAAPLTPTIWYGSAEFTTEGTIIPEPITATVDYEITRNADKTLTIACTVDKDVTGLAPQINLSGFHNMVNEAGVWTYTTTDKYTDGDKITVEFYMAYAGGAKGLPVEYTVGSANTKPAPATTFTFTAGEKGQVKITPSNDEINYAYVFCNTALLNFFAEIGIKTEEDFLKAVISTAAETGDIYAIAGTEEMTIDIKDFAKIIEGFGATFSSGTYNLLVTALDVTMDGEELVITPVGEMFRYEGVVYEKPELPEFKATLELKEKVLTVTPEDNTISYGATAITNKGINVYLNAGIASTEEQVYEMEASNIGETVTGYHFFGYDGDLCWYGADDYVFIVAAGTYDEVEYTFTLTHKPLTVQAEIKEDAEGNLYYENTSTGLNKVMNENINKMIENGQLYIIKNGVRYTVVGAKF